MRTYLPVLLVLAIGACGESPVDPLAAQRACWAAGNTWWGWEDRATGVAVEGCARPEQIDSIRAACLAGLCRP